VQLYHNIHDFKFHSRPKGTTAKAHNIYNFKFHSRPKGTTARAHNIYSFELLFCCHLKGISTTDPDGRQHEDSKVGDSAITAVATAELPAADLAASDLPASDPPAQDLRLIAGIFICIALVFAFLRYARRVVLEKGDRLPGKLQSKEGEEGRQVRKGIDVAGSWTGSCNSRRGRRAGR
jgi:hypothetical protein